MAKKSFLGLAVAITTLAMAGCQTSSTDGNTRVNEEPLEAGAPGSIPKRFAPVFAAGNSDVPLNSDALFGDLDVAGIDTDGTAQTADTTPPVTTAINDLAGTSQTAPFDFEFNAEIDPQSVKAGQSVYLIELKNRDDNDQIDAISFKSIRENSDGQMFEKPNDEGLDTGPIAMVDYDVTLVKTQAGNIDEFYIRMLPLKPLKPRTKYIVAITNDVKDVEGRNAFQSAEYESLLGDGGLPSSRLIPLRANAQASAEIAVDYISAVTGETITENDLVLTHSFTTNGGLLGLKSMANPTFFLSETISVADAKAFLTEQGETVAEGITERALYSQLAEKLELASVIDVPKPRFVQSLDPATVDSVIDSSNEGAGDGGALSPAQPAISAVNAVLTTLTLNNVELSQTGASPAYFVPDQGDVFSRFIQGVIELPNYLAPVATENSNPTGIDEVTANVLDKEFKADFSVGDKLGPLVVGEGFVAGQQAYPLPDEDVDRAANKIVAESNVTYRFPFAKKQPVADTFVRQIDGAPTTPRRAADSEEQASKHYAPFMLTVPARVNYNALASALGSADGNIGFSPIAKDCTNVSQAPLVIYVHGITTNRATSVGLGTILAANCVATLAIDLPLHGIAAVNASPLLDQFAIELTDAVNNGLVPGNSPYIQALQELIGNGTVAENSQLALVAERHDNIRQNDDGSRSAMIFDADSELAMGESGEAFINFLQLTRLRDNLRQGVVDLLNLNASVPEIARVVNLASPTVGTVLGTPLADIPLIGTLLKTVPVEGRGNIIPLLELDPNNVSVAAHSLGAYIATAYAAVNNDSGVSVPETFVAGSNPELEDFVNTDLRKFTTLILANGGSQIVKGLENSPALAPVVVDGLANAGVKQGSANFEKFLYIAQSAIDEVDPGVAAADLVSQDADTNVLLFNMVGGGALPADREGIALADYVTESIPNFLPDDTIPNFDYFGNPEKDNPFAVFIDDIAGETPLTPKVGTAVAPMVGGDGLAKILSTTTYEVGTTYNTSPLRIETRFSKGTHSTFAAADFFDAFAEMGVQVANFVDDQQAFTGTPDGQNAVENPSSAQ